MEHRISTMFGRAAVAFVAAAASEPANKQHYHVAAIWTGNCLRLVIFVLLIVAALIRDAAEQTAVPC